MAVTAPFIAQLAVGLVFGAAALSKLQHPLQFATSIMAGNMVGRRVLMVVALLVIPAEALIAVSQLTGLSIGMGLKSCAVLLTVFALWTTWVLVTGKQTACNCFGSSATELVSWRSLVRILWLVMAAIIVSVDPVKRPLEGGLGTLSVAFIGAAVVVAGVQWSLHVTDLNSVLRSLGVERLR